LIDLTLDKLGQVIVREFLANLLPAWIILRQR